MELSSNSKVIKKKSKKKSVISNRALIPLIKPDKFDGVSNWTRMQEVLGITSDQTKKMQHKKSNFGITPDFGDYKSPFRHKASVHLSDFIPPNRPINQSQNISNKYAVKYSDVVKNSTSSPMSPHKEREQTTQSTVRNDKNAKMATNGKIETESPAETHKSSEIKLTKVVAIDCEMVGTGPSGEDSMIARVSLVNAFGDCLYDEFVKPKEKVTDYRTKVSGIRPSDLKKGKDLFEVQKDVVNIIEGRILVGHALKHDLDVLFISHPRHLIRDTAHYKPFRQLCGGRTPSLKKLTSKILECEIQTGEHSSVEDAQAAMLLYLRQRREWEYEVKSRRKRKPKIIKNQTES